MIKLYIVGNGFDVAHGLDTKYWKLRMFLEDRYPDFLYVFENLYGIQPLDDTEPWYTEKAQKRWNENADKDLWSSFEEVMGYPDTIGMLDSSLSILDDMDLDGGNIGIEDTMDEYWREQFGFINQLQGNVKEWIETIETNDLLPKKKSLINANDDIYFSFNYTNTLEQVYKIEDVLHIHGGVESICDNEPIMGHCNMEEIKKHRLWARKADDEYDEGESSIHNAIADYLETIYKDTEWIINQHRYFFDSLKDVDTVEIIGWSAGIVDIPYLKKIKENIKLDAKWIVYWYDNVALSSLKSAFKIIDMEENDTITFIQSDKFWD